MQSFLYPALAAGFALVLAPPLIHLINLLRLRKVKWAAMEFLLQSYKRHRRWVWLRQLLLLLLRMIAIAVVVMMLAKWDPRNHWLGQFAERTTHHYVLLDDSYSMSENVGAASVFDTGNVIIQRLAAQAGQQSSPHRLTLLRFSRAGQSGAGAVAAVCDLSAEIIDQEFDVTLEERRRAFGVSELSGGPLAAMETARQLMQDTENENRIVYVVSDFRANEWDNPAELREAIQTLEDADAEVQLVQCVEDEQNNLAVTDIRFSDETRAAGVPVWVHVTVRNHGLTPAKDVKLRVRTKLFDPNDYTESGPQGLRAIEEDLPIEAIREIPAQSDVERRFRVHFATPGRHVIEAFIEGDAVDVDNRRWRVMSILDNEPALVIDGDAAQRNALYMTSIFQPGGRKKTGIAPELQNSAYLRDASPETLGSFRSIYLTDVDRLDEQAVENLEAYVRAGGGLAFFVGPHVNFVFYNQQLYRDGEGLFPLPLGRDELLPPAVDENTPDITVAGEPHPILQELVAVSPPLWSLIDVERYLAPPKDWQPGDNDKYNTIASFYNSSPFIVEKQFGEGKVVAFMSSYAPDWNDMALGPNALVTLKLHHHLSAAAATDERLTGSPIDVQLDAEAYRSDLTFVAPTRSESAPRLAISRRAEPDTEQTTFLHAQLGGAASAAMRGETDLAGVYEAWATTIAGDLDVQRYAINVAADEGDLRITPARRLLSSLLPTKPVIRTIDDFALSDSARDDFGGDWMFVLVLASLLLLEQFTAFKTSYHPPRGGA